MWLASQEVFLLEGNAITVAKESIASLTRCQQTDHTAVSYTQKCMLCQD